MTTTHRLALAAAALLLGLTYLFPLWHISLEAPQYPEGIGMYIEIDTIRGEKPNDLENINGLNHYIGMQRIEPDAIAELRWMPWIMGALLALGLGAAVAGRPWMLYAWTGVFLAAAVAGLVDFYLWGYDYGHNLDPTAAIQVPGMTYQPPVIGSKALLNFTAHSWPALGGWAAFAALATGLVLSLLTFRRPRPRPAPASSSRRIAMMTPSTHPLFAVLLPAGLMLAGCTPGPRPVAYGEDGCAHCRMTVSDARYAAELVTTTGKTFVFDSVECLAAYVREADPETIHSLWVTDFQRPEALVALGDVFFLRSENLKSPMGRGLTAFGPGLSPEAALNAFGGEILTWEEVLALPDPHAPHAGHALPAAHGALQRTSDGR